MASSKLRIYYGPEKQEPESSEGVPSKSPPGKVSLPLSEVFPLLAEAIRSERAWLRDFDNDEVIISADLYEVLLAYRRYRQSLA